MNWQKLLAYYKKYQQMQIWLRAESLSFYSMLAIVPVVGSCFWVINQLPAAARRSHEIKDYVLNHFAIGSNEGVIKVFDQIISSLQNSKLSYALLFIFIFSFHKLIVKFSKSIDNILKVRTPTADLSSNYMFLMLRRSSLVIFIPVVFILTFLTTLALKTYLPDFLSSYLSFIANFVIGTTMFFFIYLFSSTQGVTPKSALQASAIVVLAIEILKKVFIILNKYMFTTTEIYGIFAAIPFTLLWLQVSWVTILFGALILRKKDSKAS